MYFEPGLEKVIPFTVNNYDGPSKLFMVEISTKSEELRGILEQVVHIREQELMIEKGELGTFHAEIKLPSELSIGMHEILVKVVSVDPSEQQGQIRIRKALGFKIILYSLYPGKLVDVKLFGVIPVNIGEFAYFKTRVMNIGTDDIDNTRAKVDVYHGNNLVGSVYSDYIPLTSKGMEVLTSSLLITEGYEIGEYEVRAFIEYDGKTEEAKYSQKFNVGELSISILNITSRKFENNKINKFDIVVESKWNKPADVYANIILTDLSGVEITKFKTQTVTVEGWRQGVVPVYFDVKNIENDNYMLKIVLNYAEKTSVRTFVVHIGDVGEAEIVEEMPGMPKQSIIIILLSTVIGLLVVIVLMMFFKRRRVANNEIQ